MKRLAAFLIAICAAQACWAEDLGRLFFTPEQRSALDARRKARVPDKPAAVETVASPTTRLDGYVKRSGGPSTVWVNGESVPENTPQGPRIDETVSLPVGDAGARVGLKPGQVLNRGTGEVRDVIGEGEIRVRRAPAGK
jgi:hypothetical protein